MKIAVVKSGLLSAAVFFCLSTQAMALPTAGELVVLSNGSYGTTSGGEFNVDVGVGGTTDYISFCLEHGEYVSMGTTYVIDTVADYASGAAGDDPLAPETKWVFWKYVTDAFGGKSDALANTVQNVIWWLEGEVAALSSSDAITYNGWIVNVSDFSTPGYTVKVLNLKTQAGASAQSQIIGDPVPEPTTMLLFGAGLAGLAAVDRRRRNN